ncbi:alpha-1,2-fucosyltransferase [Microbacterium esteraromaticum]|uniref:Alpha-1,2-fucosyltransferase n=1 Tax=Microbacterium esteraromaticum TaxID=57043 RepID=A0A939DWJ1_9MICO|nr:alpha-1,2-fucosyltransferase [Microbacterium esteraromaticum]MBN8415477.1 alpha-1,2-fucosyltransferase [Microbacterium esteraromaticum]
MKRLTRHSIDNGRQRLGAAVDTLRRGDNSVVWAPQAGLRLGNLLYLWLHAHQQSAIGTPVVVVETQGMQDWWEQFPALRSLSVTRAEVRFSDRREWDATWLYQRFGVDFERAELRAFIHDVFADRAAGAVDERLVVNVRRGDFYGTEFEAKHGFDVIGYTTAAVERFPAEQRVLVVSDDPEWCRCHLGDHLRSRFRDVEYAAPDPLQNLLALASARRLIGANSTFSYWGAYIADALHPDVEIVMPRFHARMAHGTDAHQLDPRWTALAGFH